MTALKNELQFRQGYFSDRVAFTALADLLQDVFDIDILALDRFGGPNLTAMPFGYFDAQGRCVANFSAFSMPLMVEGRLVDAVGYQSGAVRPEYRGQGLYRDLMRRAFAWSDEQGFELGLLLTDKPKLYQSYGFQAVDQSIFTGAAPKPGGAGAPPVRLSMDEVEQISLLQAKLASRTPVSSVFAVASEAKTFLLNACFDPSINLSYLPDLDAIAAWRVDEAGVLHLLDIVADEMPSLDEIVGGLGIVADCIVVHFPPDRLGWSGYAVGPAGWPCDLMLRAPAFTALPAGFVALSPMAEF
ncbi:GNAT family N-acetyltransferase [Rhizobium sp. KVB221]|uniref:GNAT family N-acetyltransferase n=1 Tax=Rhizobium setariae TaxID=2801340 RepID=A0A936YSH0_9HYPH|nr:GNAT family N-acetyltransferase [Rhizobium setariae]MBL0371580.1 GNAT family N-acetyltransferase [Rhizobium setariae]